jgi:hypothetical protein
MNWSSSTIVKIRVSRELSCTNSGSHFAPSFAWWLLGSGWPLPAQGSFLASENSEGILGGQDVPLLALCPAWKAWGTATTVEIITTTRHSKGDETVPSRPDLVDTYGGGGACGNAALNR